MPNLFVMSEFYNNESGYTTSNSIETSEFGNFQDTKGWIECDSKSYPGKLYFFNLRSRCSTWVRPVSSHVQLQHYSKNSMIYNSNVTSDVDNTIIIVSSESEKEDDGEDQDDDKNAIKKQQSFCTKHSELKDSLERNDNMKEEIVKKNRNLSNVSDFRKMELFVLKNQSIEMSPLESRKVDDKRKLPENGEEGIKKNGAVEKYRKLLNLQNLKCEYLTEKVGTKKKKVKKIVCEMNDCRTVNYDDTESELPPGVKCTKLSSSSATSSLCQAEDPKPNIWSNFNIPNVKSDVELSNAGSWSCNSSCSYFSDTDCSCSSRSTNSSKNEASY